MWIGDTLFSSDEPGPRDRVPDLAAAARFRDPAAAAKITQFEVTSGFEMYDGYLLRVEHAPGDAFPSLAAFYVNTEAAPAIFGEGDLRESRQPPRQGPPGHWREWLWNAHDPGEPEEVCVNPAAGLDWWRETAVEAGEEDPLRDVPPVTSDGETILAGWLVHRFHDRVDEDVTCVTDWYLFETDRRYVHAWCYVQTLH